MKIVFISCYFNHHQKALCDCFYKETDGDFYFIATEKMSEERRRLGYQNITASYVISINDMQLTSDEKDLINKADLVILGDARTTLVEERLRQNKLTFLYSERIYKRPVSFVKLFVHKLKFYFRYRRHKSLYLLCASAYAAGDYNRVGCFKNKAFKWGYFPQTILYDNIDSIIARKYSKRNSQGKVKICWAGRFIAWKHPEVMIEVARRLRNDNISFSMVLIGDGPLKADIELLTNKYKLIDDVHLLGAMNPNNVRKEMEDSDVFLFTSDKNEGWGAVLNEAMNSMCAVIANKAIGSVPFLLKNGINGFIYDGSDFDDLYFKVRNVILSPELRTSVSKEAYNTIIDEWNAKNAVERLVQLSRNIDTNKKFFSRGLCSITETIKD